MKFSYKWLRELSGTTKSPEELAALLTVRAFEVEDIEQLGSGLEKVVIGHVVSMVSHPDADRLNVAMVDVGNDELLQIVCGAPNLAVGQNVPVALVGAKLPTGSPHDDGKQGFFEIKKSRIRGVESNGMICAEDELGLGDDHEGIMVLAEDAIVGMLFAQYIGLDDVMIDIDILPNRAHDCLSHVGVAREIVAMEGQQIQESVKKSDIEKVGNSDKLNISIDTDKCLRYAGAVIENIDNTVSTPQWMVARLTVCGLRSINPIVDITNYVMLETGQPLHAFSSEKIQDKNGSIQISVRQAQEGEKMTLLDDKEIELNIEDVVITDGTLSVALAGVMGGKDSGVEAETTTIILEVAAFDAATIRATRTRHNIQSDAAYRFERDIDPNIVAYAQARAVELIVDICGGTVMASQDLYATPVVPWTVEIMSVDVMKLLGVEIAIKDIVTLLELIDISVEQKGEVLVCTIPTVRRDLHTVADLIEEIGRLYGYENIDQKALTGAVAAPEENEQRIFEHKTRDFFVTMGCDEVKGYSFYAKDDASAVGFDVNAHVALMNPMSTEQSLMRRTLVPAMLRASARNLTHTKESCIFEVGRTYVPSEGDLPQEQHVVAFAVVSKDTTGQQFFTLKGIVDAYLRYLGISGQMFRAMCEGGNDVDLHPSRQACICLSDDTVIGVIGEATKKAMKHFGIKNARVAVCEIDLDVLEKAVAAEQFFTPLSKYPVVERDLSMIVGTRTRVADVECVLYAAGGDLLQDIDLFDLYINPKTEERSMAFRFRFCSTERTLTSKEVDAAVRAMIDAVEHDENITVKK